LFKAASVSRVFKAAFLSIVLLGLIAGTLAWARTDKSVLVRVDGQDRTVHTSAATVQGVLSAAHLSVGQHDLLAPSLDSKVHNGSEIVLRRGHLLRLTVNGQNEMVWVNATSVAEAMAQLGFSGSSYVSVSRSERLDAGTTNLMISSPKRFTVQVNGKLEGFVSPGPTVRDALRDAHVVLGPHDRVIPDGALRDGETIRIERVVYTTTHGTVTVAFKTVTRPDPQSYTGTNTVLQPGQNGSNAVTYRNVYVDGKLAGKVVISSKQISAPVPEIDKVGTLMVPDFVSATADGSPQRIAAGMVASRGWGSDQFSCLVSLWNKESGWRTDAANPSGAYGIPQALPGSKMASAGPDWETDAATQITWGLDYISSVYGTPCAAWAHSEATNWY
jgi:uncharacterized protein YabE (DUF348 family)